MRIWTSAPSRCAGSWRTTRSGSSRRSTRTSGCRASAGCSTIASSRISSARSGGTAPDDALLLVKEPNGSQSADVIMRAQPEARLLFLLRDGRDVVDSELASFVVGGWQERLFAHMRGVADAERLDFVTNSAYQWLWRTEVVEAAFAEHRGPKHMLRYEELLSEPAAAPRRALQMARQPLGPSEVAGIVDRFAFERQSGRGPTAFNRSATPGAWRENLRPEERAAVEDILGAKLRELGYD